MVEGGSLERTLVLVKPDGVCRRRIGKAVDRFEQAGLRLAGLKMTRLSKERAQSFYQEHVGKPFFPGLLTFMTSAPIVAMAWEGAEAVKAARGLMGATDSQKAEPGTLRREFGTDNRYNFVHGSDSPASAAREIAFFFSPDELQTYGPDDWKTAS